MKKTKNNHGFFNLKPKLTIEYKKVQLDLDDSPNYNIQKEKEASTTTPPTLAATGAVGTDFTRASSSTISEVGGVVIKAEKELKINLDVQNKSFQIKKKILLTHHLQESFLQSGIFFRDSRFKRLQERCDKENSEEKIKSILIESRQKIKRKDSYSESLDMFFNYFDGNLKELYTEPKPTLQTNTMGSSIR
jgi:hypothetical protein